MNYIRKAVELADGFEVVADNLAISGLRLLPCDPDNPHQVFLDALAAQLVRQVDALDEPMAVIIERNYTTLMDGGNTQVVGNEGRTMNTIKAIVDSKVLE